VSAPLRTLVAGAALGAGLRALYVRAVRAKLEHDVAALNRGDIGPVLSNYAKNATLVFPGDSSWGRTYHGRDEIEAFLRRFVASGLRGEIEELTVSGPPWRTIVAMQFNDEAVTPDGEVFYTNRAVIYARLSWGRMVREEVYEDTQLVPAFEDRLAQLDATSD
jgi:ketosteroid isomerase-like protein